MVLVCTPMAFIVSVVGLFKDSQKGWAIAGAISTVGFVLWFLVLTGVVNC